MEAASRFTPETIQKLRKEIALAGGNEVFALGFCNSQGLVAELRITARGNEGAVLALDEALEGEWPDVLIHNHPSGFLTPSDNDMMISARAAGGRNRFVYR